MERAEIVCESLVDEFAIDGKIMDVVISDGQRLRAYPIQTIFYDLNGLRSCRQILKLRYKFVVVAEIRLHKTRKIEIGG